MVSFRRMMKASGKYKDLLCSFEGGLSIALGALFTFVFYGIMMSKPVEFINQTVIDWAMLFIPCLLGMLGFTLSGLAFVSGTISLKATGNLFKKKKIKIITSILFTFYFLGWVIGVDVLLFFVAYLLAVSDFSLNAWALGGLTFVIAYTTFFIIFYSIGLFSTCINIFFVNFQYNLKDEDNEDES